MSPHTLALIWAGIFIVRLLPGSMYRDPKTVSALIDWKGPHVYLNLGIGLTATFLTGGILGISPWIILAICAAYLGFQFVLGVIIGVRDALREAPLQRALRRVSESTKQPHVRPTKRRDW